MSHIDLADRLRITITNNGGYEKVSQQTGISVSTLKRSASGRTEPKFKDVMAIAECTGTSVAYLAYGNAKLNPEMQAQVIVDAIQYFNTGEDKPKVDYKMIHLLFSMFGGVVEAFVSDPSEKKEIEHLSKRALDLFKVHQKSK